MQFIGSGLTRRRIEAEIVKSVFEELCDCFVTPHFLNVRKWIRVVVIRDTQRSLLCGAKWK